MQRSTNKELLIYRAWATCDYSASQVTQLCKIIVSSYDNFLACTFGHILDAGDSSRAVPGFGCKLLTRKRKKNSNTQVCSGVTLRLFIQTRLLTAFILLVRKDFQFLGFPQMFPTGNEGEYLFIAQHTCTMQVGQSALLSRFTTRLHHKYHRTIGHEYFKIAFTGGIDTNLFMPNAVVDRAN